MLELDFEYWRQIRIQTKEGIGTCWEESPRLAIDAKVYKKDVVSNLKGVRECAQFSVFL